MPIQRLRIETRYSESSSTTAPHLAGQLAGLRGDIRSRPVRPWPTSTASWPRPAAQAGSSRCHHLEDMADYAGLNVVCDAWVPGAPGPRLRRGQAARPAVLVEMMVVAAQA